MRFEDVKDVLLADLDIARSQVKASEDWHVRVSIIFTLTIITATLAVFAINTNIGPFKPEILFGLINLVILAQFAFLLNYHFIYLQLWAKYVYLIERKIQILFGHSRIIEFETEFARTYFYQAGFENPSGAEVSSHSSPSRRLPVNLNAFLILIIHAPSLAIYIAGTYLLLISSNPLFIRIIVGFIFSLLLAAVLLIYVTIGRTKRDRHLKRKIEESISEFEDWLKSQDLVKPRNRKTE